MFKSKHRNRASSNPPIDKEAISSAATAAAQAFLKQQASNQSLSNAAAAAALRSHTTSPAPISEVQTKRMIRRGSVSSIGSANGSIRQPFSSNLQRRGSSGSLSQRSFRSPSPGQKDRATPVPTVPEDAPPVPSLPVGSPPIPNKSTRRTGSNQNSAQTSRQNSPERVRSPPLDANRRSSSMDESKWAAAQTNAARRSMPVAPRLAQVQEIPGQSARNTASPTPTSPRSVNFSRPMSPAGSATYGSMNTPKPRPASSLGLSQAQYNKLQQRNEGYMLARRQAAEAFAALEASDSGLQSAATAAATAAGQQPPRPSSSQAGRVTAKQAQQPPRPASAMGSQTYNVATRQMEPPMPPLPKTTSAPALAANKGKPRPVSANAVPPPSAEQIKAFQTRAAALLARPNPQAPAPEPAVPKAAPRPTTMFAAPEPSVQPASAKAAGTLSTPVAKNVPRSQSVRGTSSSPGRSARFSASPLLDVTKHDPPPRSVSPVKSAMKGRSPVRSSSPGLHTRDASDHSDAKSLASEDGRSTPSGKKRKSARVSFEDKPITVGQSAGNVPTETVLSPQYKKMLAEADTGMGDRPALPSFGSVRGRREQSGDAQSGSLASVVGGETPQEETTNPHESSVNVNEDHASNLGVGDVVASEAKDAGIPQVVPGSISHSVAAPDIAVQPATPGLDESRKLEIPEPSGEGKGVAHGAEHAFFAGNAPDATHPRVDEPAINKTAVTGPPDEDSDADPNETFSDSVEDQSELDEAGGFASLDAIVESPTQESKHEREATIPESPTPATTRPAEVLAGPYLGTAVSTDEAQPVPAQGEDWDLVRAYWSSLSDQKKQELESEANPDSVNGDVVPIAKAIPPQSPLRNSAQVNGEQLPPWPDKQYQSTSTQSTKPAQKQSAPTTQKKAPPKQSSEPTHMRKSMRSQGEMAGSLRGPPQNRNRPQSMQQTAKGPGQKKPQRPQSTSAVSPEVLALAQATAKNMTLAGLPGSKSTADDEDSDSSFRKRRGSSSTQGTQRYSMAKSMRSGQAPKREETRVTSPVMGTSSSRRPVPRSFRQDSADSIEKPKSGGFLGLGGKKKEKKSSKSKAKSSGGPRFTSRFADSSDEDSDGGPSRFNFRSRFDDSDDDEPSSPRLKPAPRLAAAPKLAPAAKLTPVRGIPRKAGQEEGDSTDLSDDETVPSPSANRKNRPGTPPANKILDFGGSNTASPEANVQANTASSPIAGNEISNGNTAEGKVLSSGTLRAEQTSPPTSPRRSFFGMGRKIKPAPAGDDLSQSKWASTAPSIAPSGRVTPTDAAARPTTPSRMNKTLRSRQASPTPSRKSGILRRLSLSNSAPTSPAERHQMKEDFPFPPPPIPEEFRQDNVRPNTSDGSDGIGAVRPPLNKRDSAMTAPSTIGRKSIKDPVYSERTGRKKKFQGLRRVFGLNN